MTAPLTGCKVVVTRAQEDAGPLAERLRSVGAEVVLVPSLVVRAAIDPAAAADAVARLERTAWVALASRNGVRFFARMLREQGARLAPGTRIAVVGPGTEAEVRAHASRRDLGPAAVIVAEVATGEGLADVLLREASPADGEVLFAAAAEGRRVAEQRLAEAGFVVRRLVVYETVPASAAEGRVELPPGIDYVLLMSPSAVKGLLARTQVPSGARVVTLGPTTTRAARAMGLVVAREAHRHTLDGLVDVLLQDRGDTIHER